MSVPNEEMIASLRKAYEAFNSEDFDSAIKLMHPEIEFVRPGGQTSVQGVQGLRAWMEPDAFEKQIVDPVDFSVEGQKVLVRQQGRVRGAASGIEMEIESWAVWTFDEQGLAKRLEFYLHHEEVAARKAAGLSSEPG
jgi:ketosteroid isomerase-like protein